MTGDPWLEVAGVRLSYERSTPAAEVLRGVDLVARRGEVVALVGPNGAGKTSLLRVILGRLVPTAGRVLVGGREPGRSGARAGIGWVPERPDLPPGLRGAEWLRLHATLHGLDAGAVVPAALARHGLADLASRRVEHLSFGQRRRLALAAACLAAPSLLVLDEASTGLDPAGQEEFAGLVRSEAGRGAAVILCTHDLGEVAALASRVVVLGAGRVVAEGPVDEVLPGVDLAARRAALLARVAASGEGGSA